MNPIKIKKIQQVQSKFWKGIYDIEDRMHPGFEDDDYTDSNFDVKDGFKTFSIYQVSKNTKTDEEKEREIEEEKEREKYVIRMERSGEVRKKVKDSKIQLKVQAIISSQDDLFELSKWIRNYKNILDNDAIGSIKRYNLNLQIFYLEWKKICDKIKSSQNETTFFRHVNNLWDAKDVKIERSEKGIKKVIYKCSKCSQWENAAFAYMRASSKYSPPICRRCYWFDVIDKQKK